MPLSLLPERLRGVPVLVGAAFLFASMAVLARIASPHVSVGQLVCARFVLGLLALAIYYGVTRRRPRFGRGTLWALRGIFGGGAVYLYFTAIERLAVGPATLLNSCGAIFGAVFSGLFLRERVSIHVLLGLLATSTGAGMVIWSTVDEGAALSMGIGAWAGISSAVLSGAAVTTVRALRSDTDAPTIFLSFCVFGLLFAAPFAIHDWRPLTWEVAWPVLGVGLTSAAAQILFTYAFGYVTAAAGGVVTQLSPALSWTMGALLLGEPVELLAVLGGCVAVTGVLWGTGLGDRLFPAARRL